MTRLIVKCIWICMYKINSFCQGLNDNNNNNHHHNTNNNNNNNNDHNHNV